MDSFDYSRLFTALMRIVDKGKNGKCQVQTWVQSRFDTLLGLKLAMSCIKESTTCQSP